MARFDDIQEGDVVYSTVSGKGRYNPRCGVMDYPVGVDFENGRTDSFTLEGKLYDDSPEAILFYVDGDNLHSTTRPIPKVPWNKVPVDTKVYVADTEEDLQAKTVKRYFSHIDSLAVDFCSFNSGATSWSQEAVTYWKYAMLAEKITIDGITYPEGSK